MCDIAAAGIAPPAPACYTGGMTSLSHAELLQIAEAAALAAGAALKDHRARWAEVEAELGREVKIRADREAEALIVAGLRRQTRLPILSEEAGWVAADGSQTFWAVDPLDGSVNYALGYPQCGVSIALIEAGRPVLGCVNLFLVDERYTGAIGLGAWLNGRPIRVSDVADKARAVLATGVPARARTDEAAFNAFMAEILAFRKVRMMGSAAAALAYVAAGRADLYQETGSMLWDVAAGCALVEAAGGRVVIEAAALDQPLTVRASNAKLG
jgi:myo-inositol-1(or 4)-monophosphatase